MLIFISGGVRSGKSSFAEKMASEIAGSENNLHYIATSKPYDDEMIARIRKHQSDRSMGLQQWRTWEKSTMLDQLAGRFTDKDVVLIDCLTTLLANELFTNGCWLKEHAVIQLIQRLQSTFKVFQQNTKATLIVSNEIFNGGIPEDSGSTLYLQQLGKLHQFLTGISDQVYLLECGLARLMKEGHAK